MDDRTLLELAAKATGDFYQHPANKIPDGLPVMFYLNDKPWSPLADDGDALRLAVKLKLLVDICKDQTEAGNSDCPYQCELHIEDSYAATRRAIVRAAAEIGKAK